MNVVEYHHTFMASSVFGVNVLSPEDKAVLKDNGVDISKLEENMPLFDKMFHFGKLTGILKDAQAASISYSDFLKFIYRGQYIPLSTREKFELEIAKKQSYTHLKGLKNKIKGEVENSIIAAERRFEYESAIKEGLVEGIEKRKSVGAIVSDIGHKLNDWKHDWGRIVETESNNIFLMGRAMEFAKKYGDDVMVYKEVYLLACRHCIEKYLTNGIGSKPILFKLSDLIGKGTNIGKKVAQWVATLTSLHPFCRCFLKVVPPRYVWNELTKRFELPKIMANSIERKSIVTITVGDKVFEI